MTTPAGWYDDPHDVVLVRFWDGCQWTAYSAPKQGRDQGAFRPRLKVATTAPRTPLHYVVPIGRSWQSIWAPYLGLFSLVPVPLISHALGAIGAIGGAIFFLTMVVIQGDGA